MLKLVEYESENSYGCVQTRFDHIYCISGQNGLGFLQLCEDISRKFLDRMTASPTPATNFCFEVRIGVCSSDRQQFCQKIPWKCPDRMEEHRSHSVRKFPGNCLTESKNKFDFVFGRAASKPASLEAEASHPGGRRPTLWGVWGAKPPTKKVQTLLYLSE